MKETFYPIIESMIALQNKLCRCAKNRNSRFLRSYHAQISHLIVHLVYLLLYWGHIWTLKRNFLKENKKPFTTIKTTTNYKNFSQQYITISLLY